LQLYEVSLISLKQTKWLISPTYFEQLIHYIYREECGDPVCQPVFWCRECSSSSDTLRSTFDNPSGQPVSDTYGSPSVDQSAPESYGALLDIQPVSDSFPSASDSYGSPSASAQVLDLKQAGESYGAPTQVSDGYGSPTLESSDVKSLGNPFSAQDLDAKQAEDGYTFQVNNDIQQPTDNYGSPAVESYGAPPLPLTANSIIPGVQEVSDSYGAPSTFETPDEPLPAYNSQPPQDNYGSPDSNNPPVVETDNSYRAPIQESDAADVVVSKESNEDNSDEQETYQPLKNSSEESSSEEVDVFQPTQDSDDLKDTQYTGKTFDEPLFRDATRIKDSYNANESTGNEGEATRPETDEDLRVTSEATGGLELATR